MVSVRTALLLVVVLLAGLGVAFEAMPRCAPDARYPDTARVWGPQEYLIVDAILRSSSPSTFPQLHSAHTAPVFRRMVDAGNVAPALDPSVPLLRRLIDLRCYDGFIGSFRARYNAEVRRGARLQEELVRLQAFLLELSALTVALTEPYAAALLPEERQALDDMRFFDTYTTLKTHLLGVVHSLGETEIYSEPQRAALADAVRRHIAILRSTLGAEERRALAAELSRLASDAETPALEETLASTAALVLVEG